MSPWSHLSTSEHLILDKICPISHHCYSGGLDPTFVLRAHPNREPYIRIYHMQDDKKKEDPFINKNERGPQQITRWQDQNEVLVTTPRARTRRFFKGWQQLTRDAESQYRWQRHPIHTPSPSNTQTYTISIKNTRISARSSRTDGRTKPLIELRIRN